MKQAHFAERAQGEIEPDVVRGGRPGALVDLRLGDPLADGFGADAELAGNAGDGALALAGLLDPLEHQPDGALPELRPNTGAGRVGRLPATTLAVMSVVPWKYLARPHATPPQHCERDAVTRVAR